MRIMRPGVATLGGVMTALCVGTSAFAQRDPYNATIHWGTGLINIPVAWVSPTSADAWVNIAGKQIIYYPNAGALNFYSRWNTNIALDTHWWGRASIGASAYSQNPEYGFFGQLLLLRGTELPFLPAVAFGARNIGPYKHEDRFLIAHDLQLGTDGKYHHVTGLLYRNFDTSPTLYGVATKEIALSSVFGRLPASTMSFSLGWGNGIFKDDGGLGKWYNDRGTIAKGLFLGARFVNHPSLNSTVTLLLENDGWDYNAGLLYDWRGLSAAFYLTELEEGTSRCRPASNCSYIYNYMKPNVTFGYNGNIIDISRGVILRTRITELTREQQRLRLEIAERERRIRGLEVSLRKAQAGELATIERRRRELEESLRQEREAIQRAEQRLRDIQEGRAQPGQPTTPPSGQPTTPPSGQTTPPSGQTTPPAGGTTPPAASGTGTGSAGTTPPNAGR
jgi:hypothetical protein